MWCKGRQGEREIQGEALAACALQLVSEGRLYMCGGGWRGGGEGGVEQERMPERSLGKNDEVICIRFSVAAAWMKADCMPEVSWSYLEPKLFRH